MNLFSCCPKKPKKSLDYVIKWVEDTDKTIKELEASIEELTTWKDIIDENISELVTEAIENYDWSKLPEEALQAKADKVVEAVEGNIAGLDENGNLIDSGYAPSDFAPVDHNHSSIIHRKGNKQATIYGYCDAYTSPYFGISLVDEIGNPQSIKSVNLNMNNIDNLARALNTPDSTPTASSDNLVTSGGVKAALDGKRDLVGQTISLVVSGQEIEIESSDVPNLIRALVTPSYTPEDDDTKLITSKAVYALKRQVDLMAQQIAILQDLPAGSKVLAFSIPKGERESLEVPAEFLCDGNYKISSKYSAALHFTLYAMCHYPVALGEPAREPVSYDTTISIAAHGSILNFNAMDELEQAAQETFEYIDEVTVLVYLNSEALSDQQVFLTFTPVSN